MNYSPEKPVPITSSTHLQSNFNTPMPPPPGMPPGMPPAPGMHPPPGMPPPPGMHPPPPGMPPMPSIAVYPQPGGPVGAIVVNQIVPITTSPKIIHTSFPFPTICQYCGAHVTTIAEQTCNCGACCLCCITGWLLFMCIQSCHGKDFCCYDAIHKCPSCGMVIGGYSAL